MISQAILLTTFVRNHSRLRPLIKKYQLSQALLTGKLSFGVCTIWIPIISQNTFGLIKLISKRKKLNVILVLDGFRNMAIDSLVHICFRIFSGLHIYLHSIGTSINIYSVSDVNYLFRTFFETGRSRERILLRQDVCSLFMWGEDILDFDLLRLGDGWSNFLLKRGSLFNQINFVDLVVCPTRIDFQTIRLLFGFCRFIFL